MSILLAIETSIPQASIALSVDGEIVATERFESHRKQNQLLFPALEKVLAHLCETGRQPEQIIIGTGPGSYSGSRISIAAAQGLATAYQCPVAGLCSFLATPSIQASGHGVAIGDARRDSYFIAEINSSSAEFEPTLLDKEKFIERLSTYPATTAKITFEPELLDLPSYHQPSEAPLLIAAWLTLPPSERDRLNSLPAQPLYLRAPFITKAKAGHPLLRKK